jgi:hypothetical protein
MSEGAEPLVGDALADPTTGLDPNHQTSTTTGTLDERPEGSGCPNRRGMVYLNLETGEARPARCARLAWRRSLAIGLANPERAITLTHIARESDPDPWQVARRRYARTREWLARMGQDPGEWTVHVEHNPKDTGFHGHIWQHGPKIPKAALQEAAHRAGGGWSRIEYIRTRQAVGAYGLKGIGYGLKGVDAEQGPAEYLRNNGGRLTHQSRGFFRSEDGVTLGVRAAERVALAKMLGGGDGRWTIATEAGARTYAGLRVG